MTALNPKSLKRWRADPVSFIEEVLIDPETNRPFVLLAAERDFLALAFRIGPDGRLLYPELIYAAPKKSGKTTLGALFVITVVVLFGGVYPEAVCCANAFEQAASRVFLMIRRIIECSPVLRAEAKLTEARIGLMGGTIIAIPSDYGSAAGSNQTVAVFDELWAYDSERARRLFDELVPPPTRKIACRLTVSYAGFANESVLLEELYKRGLKQKVVAPGLYAGDGILMAWHHEPIAPWQTESWLAEMRRSLRPNQYLRMIENRFVTSESNFIDLAAWDRCVDAQLSPVVADQNLSIYVGVDASVRHDSTAIVAATFDHSSKKVRLVFHRTFQPRPDDPLDFEGTIEATILELKHRFRLAQCRFDPYQMMSTAQRLANQGVTIEEFPQTAANLTAASQNLYELITGGNLELYPDAAMRLAVSRAVAIETPRGWRIGKEKQSHKIDVVVALAMASHAAVIAGGMDAMATWCRMAELPPLDPRYVGMAW
jgi:phage terminase large subunit-like protein